jgi:hypothetical protein
VAVGEGVLVDLRLDVHALDARETSCSASTWISLSKWPMLHTIGVVAHLLHVLNGDDVRVAGGGHKDLGLADATFSIVFTS